MTKSVILGDIYDPDTDSYYILMRCPAEEWDKFKRKSEDLLDDLPETIVNFGASSRLKKR